MDEMNKKSLAYKIQKNPFLIGLFVVLAAIVVVCVMALSSAIEKRTEEIKTPQTTAPAQTTTEKAPEIDYTVDTDDVKKNVADIKEITASYTDKSVDVTVEFNNKDALLDAHYASGGSFTPVYPVFCFYIGNGLEVKCPAELRISEDYTKAYYSLKEIDDLVTVVGLTEGKTVSYENVLETLDFNVYIQHKENESVGRTVIGTYASTSEEFNKNYGKAPADISQIAKGVERVNIISCDSFVWVDIYFTDAEAYDELNNNFDGNFHNFGFEDGGKKYEWKFITTRYDELNMVRCKYDSYAHKQLQESMEDTKITIPELMEKTVNVWSSNADDKKTDLFTVN